MADLNAGFRYFHIDAEATDFAGNVGTARASVIIVPDSFDRGDNQDSNHFVKLLRNLSETYVIKAVDSAWDTTESDLFVE